MLVFPVGWHLGVDRHPLKLIQPPHYRWRLGTNLGLLMLVVILAIYWIWGRHWLNAAEIRVKAQEIGVSSQALFLVGGTYFTLINSLVEEYVWRWFVYTKCKILVSESQAVWLSALFFTLHHIIGLAIYSHDWRVVGVGTLAVFIAGAIWSQCYRVYHSIWPSYISHALADLALQIVAWNVLFG
jgi:hypothetical protein